MKLAEHVDNIRTLITKAFNNQFARLGLGATKMLEADKIPVELHAKRSKIEQLIKSHEGETGKYTEAREKALDELTFTLFNRLAAIKVMEGLQLFPPIVTKQAEHGGRSFGHKVWLEQNRTMRDQDLEGLREYFKYEFNKLGADIPLFHKDYPYAFIPYVIEFNEIIDAFNQVEQDAQIESTIWLSDDILGWLYESYNTQKKQVLKDSKDDIEYDKVSLQSQWYTPRWVVEFLIHNSLGKLYLEMYPDSEIKKIYKIANAPKTRIRELKPLHEVKLIDPASGSGNFLLYAFAFFYVLYIDQIENYGADYDEKDIPKLIIENNLHGIDLDDRAIQLAQLGLWIKAKQKNRNIGSLHFNVVSTDFYLPHFHDVKQIFKDGVSDSRQLKIIEEVWSDLQQAYKFGSLVKIEEKLSLKLHGLVEQSGITLFGEQELTEYKRFTQDFFKNLETAVAQYSQKTGISFLTDKTKDAITFLRLITTKYDIANANPPYTDSGNFGPELKKFINTNYKQPYKFNTNLYATFIKRCFELTNDNAYIGLIHPNTFMFIKTFEDVRTFLIDKVHIDLLVDYGLDRVNLFGGDILLDSTCWYVLSKNKKDEDGIFLNIATGQQEKHKRTSLFQTIDDVIRKIKNQRVFFLDQAKFSIISSSPFIYWISDEFRGQFANDALEKVAKVISGVKTGNNNGALRLWWEVSNGDIFNGENSVKWVQYTKGGEFRKWYGNNWLCVNWENDCEYIKRQNSYNLPPTEFSFVPGITYSGSGQKGICFRYLNTNVLYDMGSSSVFPKYNLLYTIAVLNSKMVFYIVNCLNPTVNKQPNDVKRIPLPPPTVEIVNILTPLSETNINIRRWLEKYSILEFDYQHSPFTFTNNSDIKNRLKSYFNYENYLLTLILLNEAIINEKIFGIYDLTDTDKAMVLEQEGDSIGALPVDSVAKQAYLSSEIETFPLGSLYSYIQELPEMKFTEFERETIENEFTQLYKSNNDLEEFCIRHKVNPINVWYWFKESHVLPKHRMNDLAMEFLADLLREILTEDDDGIIPLVPNAGEKILFDRIEEKFREKGFSMAQYSSFYSLLGKEINEYINKDFFGAFSDHLNLFMYLPKTPFIWHLTSGPMQGFDCYIIIYKWSRDKLLRIRSVYIENRERALVNQQSDLASDTSAKAQNDKDRIYKQLKEIDSFKQKIDELLREGYDPKLDDGVGKNIAPLQKKGMLAYDVLNAGQLKKYLNADW